MWLEVTGVGSRAERDVLIATGTPRDGSAGAPQHFELEFDLEHGTPLYSVRFEGDEPAGVTEVTSVNYAPTIHPDIFSFAALENYRPASPDARQEPGSVKPSANRPALTSPRSQLTERATVWLTGLSGAGKTTIGRATERLLNQLGIPCCVLDGDEIRRGLSADLGLSREDRREQARRVAHVAATLADAGVIPIVALVSPYAEDRERARQIHRTAGVRLVEVWVDTPLEICAGRDAKGLYAAARADASADNQPPAAHPSELGDLPLYADALALANRTAGPALDPHLASDGSGLTGVTSPYEAPTSPDLRVSGHGQHPRIVAAEIVEKVFSRPPRP
jgi:adenylyl-sulfate kinase